MNCCNISPLRIRTDNNIDNTSSVVEEWVNHVRSLYHQVDFTNTSKYDIDDASTPYEWSDKRYYNIIYLRQYALYEARRVWADYLMVSRELWDLVFFLGVLPLFLQVPILVLI